MKKVLKKMTMITMSLAMMLIMMMAFERPVSAACRMNRTCATVSVRKTVTLKVRGGFSFFRRTTWRSSNPSVATVNRKGLVTARKAGRTVITARQSNGKCYRCNVTVKANEYRGVSCPGDIKTTSAGLHFFIKNCRYSGSKLICDGYFVNTSGRKVTRLSNYHLRLFSGKNILADGAFNTRVNVPGYGFKATRLVFNAGSVTSQGWDLRTMKFINVKYCSGSYY